MSYVKIELLNHDFFSIKFLKMSFMHKLYCFIFFINVLNYKILNTIIIYKYKKKHFQNG